MQRVYLDNAAATPIDKRVLEAMMPYLTNEYGNPSSLHYFGQRARSAIQKARHQVARCLRVKDDTIVFTGGGTEADNLAVLGYLRANHPAGGHIITTAVEHPAILNTFRMLSQHGYDVTVLPVHPDGRVYPADVAAAIKPETILVSVMYANNETGMIQPILEIGKLLQEKDILFHVDAVQAFGYLPIAPVEESIGMVTLCSHKIYGPKGVGALYVKPGIQIVPEAFGGPQERNLRAGTENVSGIAGFGMAAELLENEREQRFQNAYALKEYMYHSLLANNKLFQLNGTWENSLPNILNFSVKGISSDVLLIAFDMMGLAVSAGSACAAGAIEASHVLQAMGISEPWLKGSIRISFGQENTIGDVDLAVGIIRNTVKRLSQQEEVNG